ncbi:MAG TPA: fibronectin type III domain-containing protein, partial [Thermoanaerobaculia bacterium]|nr:fibronectin type III domain-containing protein [Thermoanaerobaculia bacterium]
DWPTILRLSPEPNSWTPQNPNHYQAHALSALAVAVEAGHANAATWRNWLETKTVLAYPDRYNADPTWALMPAGAGGTPPPPPPPSPEPAGMGDGSLTAPAAPVSLTVTALSSSEVQLKWQDRSSNETRFLVEQQINGKFIQIKSVTAGATSARVGSLRAKSAHTFRVRAYSRGGASPYTNTASATTPR